MVTDLIPDILLHQSGHIMLSDFDLSKQSGEPGGAPATIKQGGPNGVSPFSSLHLHVLLHSRLSVSILFVLLKENES